MKYQFESHSLTTSRMAFKIIFCIHVSADLSLPTDSLSYGTICLINAETDAELYQLQSQLPQYAIKKSISLQVHKVPSILS